MWRRSSYCDSNACVEVDVRKSSYSLDNGTCVEVAYRTATASAGNGNCVEVGVCPCQEVLVRDSKDPDGPVLAFAGAQWAEFVDAIKAGEFDR